MALKRPAKTTVHFSKDSSLHVPDDQDFETEGNLEVESDTPKKTTTELYLDAYDSLKTGPVTKFVRQCTTGYVDLKQYGIRDIGAQAVRIALERDIIVTFLCLHDMALGTSVQLLSPEN